MKQRLKKHVVDLAKYVEGETPNEEAIRRMKWEAGMEFLYFNKR